MCENLFYGEYTHFLSHTELDARIKHYEDRPQTRSMLHTTKKKSEIYFQ